MHSSAVFKVHTVAQSAAVGFFFIVFFDHRIHTKYPWDSDFKSTACLSQLRLGQIFNQFQGFMDLFLWISIVLELPLEVEIITF